MKICIRITFFTRITGNGYYYISGATNVCEDDENNKMDLICPEHQVILIFSIAFGRLNSHICPEETDSEEVVNTNCDSESSWAVGFEKCMGKQNCTLIASSEEFGDPCPGIRKYLSVSFTCRPSKIA